MNDNFNYRHITNINLFLAISTKFLEAVLALFMPDVYVKHVYSLFAFAK